MAFQGKSNFFVETASFIRENAVIVYSLVLLVIIPAAFLYNNWFINDRYGEAIDKITLNKELVLSRVINNLMADYFGDPAKLQSIIDKIMRDDKDDGDIVEISVLLPKSGEQGFYVAASSNRDDVGKDSLYFTQDALAWSKPVEGVGGLSNNAAGRFWRYTRVLLTNKSQKAGLIRMSLSLNDPDELVNRVITNSYWILAAIFLFVVLLIANQARFLVFALMVTKMKEVDKMKDTFISMASHELRSPLTAMRGYLELLRDKKDLNLDAEARHYLENIGISVQRLGSLVEDILEVSRIEGNRLPVEISDFDAAVAVSRCIEEIKSQAVQKGLALNWQAPAAPVPVRADESRFKQIIINLVSNAIKYTEKGVVDVTMSAKNGKMALVVADTGIGMSAEDQGKLFQKFYRIKNAKTADIIGTGLGLWITMEIARKMEGNITVESIEGVGSHFTLYLPLAIK
ncbi:MAG: HAMP domain-containing histidine kinase [Candidatus Pacebacteria bacterium]|jgi:signal transduction histidine kinase|nr:HAMP domain-containing histidine kinase [Candidatus Paceibacterota bacterium]